MKQKVVIKVSLYDKKTCTKVLKTAVGVDGVIQAALHQDKNQIEVTGDGIDVVLLTTLLRKSLKHAEVVSVAVVEEKKEEKKVEKKEDKKEDKKDELKLVYPPCMYTGVPVIYGVRDTYYDNHCQDPCSIM